MQINGGRISAKIFHKWLVICIRVLNKLNLYFVPKKNGKFSDDPSQGVVDECRSLKMCPTKNNKHPENSLRIWSVCLFWKGRPLHSYSFRMGLEASILFDRDGSGFLGISVFFFRRPGMMRIQVLCSGTYFGTPSINRNPKNCGTSNTGCFEHLGQWIHTVWCVVRWSMEAVLPYKFGVVSYGCSPCSWWHGRHMEGNWF